MNELKTRVNKIEEVVYHVAQNNKTQLIHEATARHQNRIRGTWRKMLNKRRQLFWQSINCENTAMVYQTWIDDDKKVIPKKFLLKFIQNESVEEKNERDKFMLEKFKTEINLLKIRAENHKSKMNQVDEDMKAFLRSEFSNEGLKNLENLWSEETAEEEYKSSERWKAKQQWLENYAQEFKNSEFIKSKEKRDGKNTSEAGKKSPKNNDREVPNNKSPYGSNRGKNSFRRKRVLNQRKTDHRLIRMHNRTDYYAQTRTPAKEQRPTYQQQQEKPFKNKPTYAEATRRQPKQYHSDWQQQTNLHFERNQHFLYPRAGRNHAPDQQRHRYRPNSYYRIREQTMQR